MNPRYCDVEGCNNPHSARGYCEGHYARYRRTGSPLGKNIRKIPPDRLRYLRRLVGLPDDGPTEEMRRRWNAEEGAHATVWEEAS